jgi:WD40 repeat protein
MRPRPERVAATRRGARSTLVFLATCALAVSGGLVGQNDPAKRAAKETLLSAVSPPVVEARALLMPDSLFQVRGLLLPECVVSPDGRHAAWVWRERHREFVIHEGRSVGGDHESINSDSLVFSPDSRHLAFVAKDQGKSLCILDGVPGKSYDNLWGRPVFSADGLHLAYVVETDGMQVVVLDGKEQAQHSACEHLVFSPDSQHLAYAATDGKRFAWVVDGVPGKTYDEAKWGNFSPEGNHFAYVAKLGGKKLVVLDGKEQKLYRNILSSMFFSPDGNRFAYLATDFATLFFVLDGKEMSTPFSIESVVFSPDSRRVAYVGGNAKGDRFTVIDGKETVYKSHGFMGGPIGWRGLRFSPDSRHVAFGARDDNRGKGEFVVVDGKEGPLYDNVDGKNLAFSPDSNHLAYIARTGKKFFAVVDGQEGKRYDGLFPPIAFSADGKHAAYLVQLGKNSWAAVIDGEEGEPSFSIVPESARFDSSGSFRYLALRPGPQKIQDPKTKQETSMMSLYLVEESSP